MIYSEEELKHAKGCYLETHIAGKNMEYQTEYNQLCDVMPDFMETKTYEEYVTAAI